MTVIREVFWIYFLTLAKVGAKNENKCETCNTLISSFNKGLTATEGSNFGGGNTRWEESRLGSFAYSETRLVEITENLCPDSNKACQMMLEAGEEILEKWWFNFFVKKRKKDVFSFVCIENLKACCPNGTYGISCKECSGGKILPCSSKGKCDGDGTRSGDGKCNCNAGYEGDICDECADDYFESYRNDTSFECQSCHQACSEGCDGPNASDCNKCANGWMQLEGATGCTDKDECNDKPCDDTKEFCTNSEGSYICTPCHAGCEGGCIGPSDGDCVKCSVDYLLEGNICKRCHDSCKDGCSALGPENCNDCRKGWKHEENVCIDEDECSLKTHSCTPQQFCKNSEGSFLCLACDNSCDGCLAAGSDNCLRCKSGYKFSNGSCLDIDECTDEANVCLLENERCVNTVGNFECKCKNGFVRKRNSGCLRKASHATKSKKKKTSARADDSFECLKYISCLVGFCLAARQFKASPLAQLIFSVAFYLYLFWFSTRVEQSMN